MVGIMSKALILGVSSVQIDAIRYLKAHGWWVIGCSYRNEGAGLELIDQFELIDITDCKAIEELGRKEKIDLIYSVGSDFATTTVAKVASILGLPTFIPYETAELMQNKVVLRKYLADRNISPIKFKKVSSENDIEEFDHFPAILKPVDSQGQRGIYCGSLQEIKSCYREALKFSRSKTLIVEELLDGPELSANVFVIDSKIIFNEISDRLTLECNSVGIPRSHILPTKICYGETLCETKALIERCIQALSIENGPVYFQIKLTSKGPRIIEITPRLDGCHLWRLIKNVYGVDLLASSLNWLIGDKYISIEINPFKSHKQLSFFYGPTGNVFRKLDYPIGDKGVSYVEYYYKEGDTILAINGSIEKVGYYIESAKEKRHENCCHRGNRTNRKTLGRNTLWA